MIIVILFILFLIMGFINYCFFQYNENPYNYKDGDLIYVKKGRYFTKYYLAEVSNKDPNMELGSAWFIPLSKITKNEYLSLINN